MLKMKKSKGLIAKISPFIILLFGLLSMGTDEVHAERSSGSSSWSSGTKNTASEQYLDQMTTKYGFKLEIVDSLDWVFVIGMAIASALCIVALCALILSIVLRLFKVLKGNAELGDLQYWKKILISLLLLIGVMSGLFVVIMEKFYGGVTSL